MTTPYGSSDTWLDGVFEIAAGMYMYPPCCPRSAAPRFAVCWRQFVMNSCTGFTSSGTIIASSIGCAISFVVM